MNRDLFIGGEAGQGQVVGSTCCPHHEMGQ